MMENVIKIKIINMLFVIANGVEVLGNGDVPMIFGMDIVQVKVQYHMVTLDMEILLNKKFQDKFKLILHQCVILDPAQ